MEEQTFRKEQDTMERTNMHKKRQEYFLFEAKIIMSCEPYM